MRPFLLIVQSTIVLLFATSYVWGMDPSWVARGHKEMVATESEQASRAGLAMLEAGGNAFDAAVAVSFALAVTRPYHTGLGGGGFLMARLADGRVIVQDFRERAPKAATSDMYVKTDGAIPELRPSEYGYRAVAVPGLIAGRCWIQKQYGKLDLATVTKPAISLAESGFAVDRRYVDATEAVLAIYTKYPSLKHSCGYVWRTHLREGNLRSAGDVLVQPELARLISGIAKDGPDFFYRGPVADALVGRMNANGGIITRRDLAEYQPKLREPLIATYRDYTLILMPPPSSGGIAIAQTLNILEQLKFSEAAKQDPIKALHFQVEAMKAAFADRAAYLGDSDFVEVPVDRLTSKSTAAAYADKISFPRPKVPEKDSPKRTAVPDDGGTSHFCIADQFGNVVVSTETINTEFGSLAAVDEWGLILNNEMDDFTAIPGEPNAFGLVQSPANAIAPGKRPISSMSPTIVLKGDEPFLLVGAAGGPRIISGTLNVILGVLDHGRPLAEAVQSPRPHHQWQPDRVFFNQARTGNAHFDGIPLDMAAKKLGEFGHEVSDIPKRSVVQAIIKTRDGWIGVSDPQGGGQPAGY
ncbi:MAG: gamma-glutamyltransferase [Phycisphaerae bacterium]|nr:gamma-glutamyltransferase [Phycisphaerae bacterium]